MKYISSSEYLSVYIPIIGGKTYTVSREILSNRFSLATSENIPTSNVPLINIVQNNTAYSLTITTTENANYLCVYLTNDGSNFNEVLDKLQIEEGSVATPYVPYNSIEFKVQNKNLGVDIFNSSLYCTGSGNNRTVATTGNVNVGQIIKVKQNTSYTISGDYSELKDSSLRFGLFNNYPSIGEVSTAHYFSTTSISFTTGVETKYLLLYNATLTVNTTVPNLFVRRTEDGDTYVPHAEQTKYFTFEEGQYLAEGGYLANDGIHNIKQIIFLKDLIWTKRSDYSAEEWSVFRDYSYVANAYSSLDLSTHFPVVDSFPPSVSQYYNCIRLSQTTHYGINILISNDIASTADDLTIWLENNNVVAQVTLPQETITPYTPTQQAQWNAIKKMKTYKNVSHISTEGGTLTPSNDVVYYKDLETLFNNLYNS